MDNISKDNSENSEQITFFEEQKPIIEEPIKIEIESEIEDEDDLYWWQKY